MLTQGKLSGRGGSIYQSTVYDKDISCMLACVLFKLSLVVILGFREGASEQLPFILHTQGKAMV
jgi:hypothetical protein